MFFQLVENRARCLHDDHCLTRFDSELQTGNASVGVLTEKTEFIDYSNHQVCLKLATSPFLAGVQSHALQSTAS